MQTTLAPFILGTREGKEAERILRACVHCGFCNATCPTYQLLGNELDGRGGTSTAPPATENCFQRAAAAAAPGAAGSRHSCVPSMFVKQSHAPIAWKPRDVIAG